MDSLKCNITNMSKNNWSIVEYGNTQKGPDGEILLSQIPATDLIAGGGNTTMATGPDTLGGIFGALGSGSQYSIYCVLSAAKSNTDGSISSYSFAVQLTQYVQVLTIGASPSWQYAEVSSPRPSYDDISWGDFHSGDTVTWNGELDGDEFSVKIIPTFEHSALGLDLTIDDVL